MRAQPMRRPDTDRRDIPGGNETDRMTETDNYRMGDTVAAELVLLATGGKDADLFRRAQLVAGELEAGGTLDAIADALDAQLKRAYLPSVKRASLGNASKAWNLATELLSDWTESDTAGKYVPSVIRPPRKNGARHVELVAALVRTLGTSRVDRKQLNGMIQDTARGMADAADRIAHVIGVVEGQGDEAVILPGELAKLRADALELRSADKSGDGTGVDKRTGTADAEAGVSVSGPPTAADILSVIAAWRTLEWATFDPADREAIADAISWLAAELAEADLTEIESNLS